MRSNLVALVTLAAVVGLGRNSTAAPTLGAGGPPAGHRQPASALLFPEYDNRLGALTLITVTNTNCDFTPSDDNPNLFKGTVDVEFVYIGKFDANGNPIPCLETNRIVRLSPCDSISLLTSAHNPQFERGFLYAFAKSPTTGDAISFNYLIGNAVQIFGIENIEYSTNAHALRSPLPTGTPTDLDDDDTLDLDGAEYELAPDRILIPRFVAVELTGRGSDDSELILIGLTGGAQWTTVADFLIYNDNEEVFSSQYVFDCWARVDLTSISGVFAESFLVSTNHAPNEILGATHREAGWFQVDGAVAFSTVAQVDNPVVYAVLVEHISAGAAASDLPWEDGKNANGDLFRKDILADEELDDH